jgi:hypothetical protein
MADAALLNKRKASDKIFNKYSIEHVVEALKSAGFMNVEYISGNGYYIRAKK